MTISGVCIESVQPVSDWKTKTYGLAPESEHSSLPKAVPPTKPLLSSDAFLTTCKITVEWQIIYALVQIPYSEHTCCHGTLNLYHETVMGVL